jgi:hypothetical protein
LLRRLVRVVRDVDGERAIREAVAGRPAHSSGLLIDLRRGSRDRRSPQPSIPVSSSRLCGQCEVEANRGREVQTAHEESNTPGGKCEFSLWFRFGR